MGNDILTSAIPLTVRGIAEVKITHVHLHETGKGSF